MDAAHLQDIEQCMKKTDEKKNAYVAAVDSQEIKITGQVTENRRVRDEDLADIRVVVGSPNTAGTPDLGQDTPRELVANSFTCPSIFISRVSTAAAHAFFARSSP